jgi:hypothetical protein
LSLTEEKEKGPTCINQNFREWDLDEWDESISDKAFLSLFRCKCSKLWIPSYKCFGEVQLKSNPTKSINDGISVEVLPDLENAKKIKLFCRDLDYNWNKELLFEALKTSQLTIGCEEEVKNPNEKHTNIYIYLFHQLFDSKETIGRYLRYRILLGTLLKRKSLVKKFLSSLIANKLNHPWQVKRYLSKKSLGRFYNMFSTNEYLKEISLFKNNAI